MANDNNETLSSFNSFEEAGESKVIWMILVFILLIIGSFGWWSSKMNVDEVAAAKGVIVPGVHAYRVQSETGGKISVIHVNQGSFVNKGDLLVSFDVKENEIELEKQKSRRKFLNSKKSRLLALTEKIALHFKDKSEFDQMEKALFDVLRTKDKLAIESLVSQKEQLKNSMLRAQVRQQGLLKEVKLLDSEIAIRKRLVKRGLNSKILLLSMERKRSEMESRLQQLPFEIRANTLKTSEIENEIRQLGFEQQRGYLQQLESIVDELNSLEKQIEKNIERVSKSKIRAIHSGIVHAMEIRSAGEVIRAGTNILEIVPKGPRYLAKVNISPADIGHVKVGQKVVLKFATYHFGRYGGIEGLLKEISPTSYMDQGAPYYKGVVSLNKEYLGKTPGKYQLMPGMTVTADIRTGGKTVMEYLLKPIFASAKMALRER